MSYSVLYDDNITAALHHCPLACTATHQHHVTHHVTHHVIHHVTHHVISGEVVGVIWQAVEHIALIKE